LQRSPVREYCTPGSARGSPGNGRPYRHGKQKPHMQITWKHTEADLVGADLAKKTDVFFEKIWGWTLYPADLIIRGGATHDKAASVVAIPHAGFACLQVILSYFEMIGRYVEGDLSTGQSKELFIRGVRFVFPQVDTMPYQPTQRFISTLYSGGRCGLYHMSMTGQGIAISGDAALAAISYDSTGKQVVINPVKLPEVLIANLKGYCDRLRDPNEVDLRKNFEKRFDKDNPK